MNQSLRRHRVASKYNIVNKSKEVAQPMVSLRKRLELQRGRKVRAMTALNNVH